ncbi:MAG: NADH-quinone oxidoreductase subunit N, partial [bacterium]|nr:NADH-quinone oxidoreductase subunit N [bacterium]
MNFDTYLSTLAPEGILIIGACVVTLLGVARLPILRQLTPPLSLGVLALALMATAAAGIPGPGDVQPPGVQVTQLSYFVRALTFFVGALILLVNWNLPASGERGEFFGMMLFSIAGVTLTASANDLVLLFFALELVSVPTYVLVALSRQDARASEAAVKYFFLGALSAAVMVYGFSFLYGCAGTTSLSGAGGLAGYFASVTAFPVYAIVGLLFALAGMAFKIAAVPFHAYAPDVYEGAASPVTG